MPTLSFSHLRYTYPTASTRALERVDLDLDSGLVLLTGASGSGKSTLLRVCNGLVPHFHGGVIGGKALVLGRDIVRTRTRDLARDVGFVFQDPELQAVYATVERDVAFGLENLGVGRGEMLSRIDDALDHCGIAHLRGRAVTTLSGGERQRLALAGVLAMRPRLLVLDEPLSQLDPDGSRALMDAVVGAVREGTTSLIAEHRVHGVVEHATRVLAMERGALVEPAPVAAAGAPNPALAQGSAVPVRRRGATASEWAMHGVSAGPAGVPLLHDLDLSAGAGEVVAVTGANGSGKTTLLRTLAGLLPPLSGRVERAPGRLAYLPQNPSALLHRATVRSEIAWTLRRTGWEGTADRALDEFGLRAVAERYPRDLSSGEQQRAALASVLAGSPGLALLDEPTRGMDPAARSALVAAVSRVAASGGGVVVATHDDALVRAIATRVIELRGGVACDAACPAVAS